MSAVDVLVTAARAGIRLRAKTDGGVRVIERSENVPPDLLAALRAHKAELAALLMGDTCRWCGAPMGWPEPAGIRLGDGTALHHHCYERAEAERCAPFNRELPP